MLIRRPQHQGKGMQAGGEFTGDGGVDGPVARDPALALKGAGDQQDGIMGLPARPRTGMAGMLGAVVRDLKMVRREACAQQGFDAGGT